MTKIFDVIQTLKNTSSRNEKVQILKQNQENHELKRFFQYALDPNIKFYIKKIPEYQKGTKEVPLSHSLDWALAQLTPIMNREKTGHAAIQCLVDIFEKLDSNTQYLLERVIEKTPDCGVQESTVNSVWKGLIADYPCMLASAYDEKLMGKLTYPVAVEVKADGMRFNAIVEGDEVTFFGRSGKEIRINYPIFKKEFVTLAQRIGAVNAVFDGELLVTDENLNVLDRQTGNGILNKCIQNKTSQEEVERIVAYLWDYIPYADFVPGGRCNMHNCDRYEVIVTNCDGLSRIRPIKRWIAQNHVDVLTFYNFVRDDGQEGIIIKTLDGVWEDKRSKNLIKMKAEMECELRVTGVAEGTGKYKGMVGALQCESEDGAIQVEVGTGMTDEQRKDLFTIPVGTIISVKYNARSKNKNGNESLSLPVFVEVRTDKEVADNSIDIK